MRAQLRLAGFAASHFLSWDSVSGWMPSDSISQLRTHA